MESIKSEKKEVNPETEAEHRLDAILDNPGNAFLTEHAANSDRINNAPTAVEALQIAEELIAKRMESTYKFCLAKAVEGVKVGAVSHEGVKKTFESVKHNQELIGEGGDAYVVIDKNEIKEFPPEICYKFAKAESTPRGRNTMLAEAEIQDEFYGVAEELPELNIGVPLPFYSTELGSDKIIAMEKLPARSVDDILRGKGSLPDWLNIKEFCDHLQQFIDELHKRGLYHRDMHVGNVMIRQSDTEPEDGKWGYMIDFGLSAHGLEGMDPYRKEIAGAAFTYSQDDAIINKLRRELNDYRNRNNGV